MVSTFILGALLAAAAGVGLKKGGPGEGPGASLSFQVRGWTLAFGPFVPLALLVELVVLVNKLTYAAYIDTPQSFMGYALLFLGIGALIDKALGWATLVPRITLLGVDLVVLMGSVMGPEFAPVGPELLPTAIWVVIAGGLALALYMVVPERVARRGPVALCAALILLLPVILGASTPPLPAQNPTFVSLNEKQTTGEPQDYISNTSEIRVISWYLATAYLHRAYGPSASFLVTDDDTLARYTDPTVLHGRFVWVNLPVFESLKWLGDRDIPSFAYVENVPENMSREDPGVLHTVNVAIDYHMERIEWSKRLNQRLFDKYHDYVLLQSRIDIDEDHAPYMVLYLGTMGATFAMPTLLKLVIVNLNTGAEQEFAVTDPAIPAWLEVVYPDWYVYQWVSFWAHSRFGWTYGITNKQHLYEPDDYSARFLVINGTTYWQIPIRQQGSNVLGGYVTVETRTGKAVFYNREALSMVDMDTAISQVLRYLASGQLGFQVLAIWEGYLYPFKTSSGAIREAYVFPLYAGLTIAKYAILDAQEYTAPPIVAESLDDAVGQYTTHTFGVPNNTTSPLVWESHAIQSAYVGKDPTSSQEEAVVTLNNSTSVVTVQVLRGGLVANAENEWRELNLAIAEHQRTGNVTVAVTLRAGTILDVDWDGSDLVTH